MGIFTEMDPELAQRLIEGYQDEITPAHRAQEALYRQFRCARCQSELSKRFDGRTAFSGDGFIPRATLECDICGYAIDPETGLVLHTGRIIDVPRSVSR